jgi:hypothetical protein
VERIIKETDLTPAPHLTCIDASRGEIDEIAREYWNMGVRHLVALRGDAPKMAAPIVRMRTVTPMLQTWLRVCARSQILTSLLRLTRKCIPKRLTRHSISIT